MESRDNGKRRKDKSDHDDYYREKRSKRPRSKSRSPVRGKENYSRRRQRRSYSRSPDRSVKKENIDNDISTKQNSSKSIPERKPKETDMLNTRTGGAYIPPARLRMLQAQITDKASVAYQRLAWEALKKSIHGHINKINVGNIGIIIKELLKENIVRGRGLLCRSVIQAQAASPTFTNVYAALVAAVNSRFPNIGELLLKRLVIQFKRGFKRNDKPTCISSASFVAHLVNQRVAHEILALELLTLLVETPTDDSVEVSIAFLKECGQKLTEVSSKGVNAIFEMLRNILHEGRLDKRVQYMIEVMFQVWKDGFKDHPALIEELELVPEEEQFTHLLMLDDATDSQDILNVFKFDEKYEENEQKYKTLSKEILGSDLESGEEDGSGGSGSEESDDEEEEQPKDVTIIDNTETNLIALRRTIYLTINSSLDFEECAHKLMKMQLKPGQEIELCHMFLDCCAEQRTYEKFYGLLAQRFCNINRIYIGPFEEIFKDSYGTAHRLDTNRLRNVSKFFAHLLFTDSISWEALDCVKLNEEDTTSSSRIYIKILFQELAEYMGLKKLNDRLKDPTLQDAFLGIFPRDNPKNTRFSINFFTSIGLGGLTDELREHLKQMPKNLPAPQEINVNSDSDSSSSSSSDDSSSDSSSSESEEEDKKKKKSKKDSNKEKAPDPSKVAETDKNKNTERWGHDGFYDTYGKDAPAPERRTDNRDFVKPRDVSRRNERDDGRTKEQEFDNRKKYNKNTEEREDRRRYEERNEKNSEEDARGIERDDRRDKNDSRRDRDDGRRDRDDKRRDKDDGRRDREENRRDRGDNRQDRDDKRHDRDDKKHDRDDKKHDRDNDKRRDKDDNRRDIVDNRQGRDDKARNNDNRRDRDDKIRDKEDNRRDSDDRDDKKRDREEGVGRYYQEKRNENNGSSRNDKHEDRRYEGRKQDEDLCRKPNKNGKERREIDERDAEKSQSSKSKNEERNTQRNSDEKKSKDSGRDPNRKDKEKQRDESDEDVQSKSQNHRQRRDSSEQSNHKRKGKEKKYEDSEDEEQHRSQKERSQKTSDKKDRRNKEDNEDKQSDEEEARRKKLDKLKMYEKELLRRELLKQKEKSESSDSEDEKKKKKKEKRKKHKKEKGNDDGWDIRGRSEQKEVGGRYWN